MVTSKTLSLNKVAEKDGEGQHEKETKMCSTSFEKILTYKT